MTSQELCEFLDARGIGYCRFLHPAVFTCEEAARLVPAEAVAVHTKNLFLRDKKGKRHWLLVTNCAKAVDLKSLSERIGADNLSLASPERLAKFLGVTPGAVTVLGLIHDTERKVELLIDAEVWAEDAWRCHPLVNTETLVLSRESLERFTALTGHHPRVLEVSSRPAA
jgi:Ala-tRNA(Pro) deacylase